MSKRIVITGLGVVSSIGIGRDAFWNALVGGESGITEIVSFDTSAFPNHFGGEVKNFNPYEFVTKRRFSRIGRASCFAISGAKLALEDAGINPGVYEKDRIGVCVGTTMGETQILEKINEDWVKRGVDAIDADSIPRYPCNVLSSNVAIELKLKGPNYVIPCACAAGNYAVGYACDLIRSGEADIMLAGGTDAFSRIAFIGFNRLFAVAPRKCQPFDKNRKGMMVAEGCGMVILESYDSAIKRRAPVYAEVLGYGLSCDAHHMTAPFSEGIKEAIQKALKESGIAPQQVDYFNAHGTGTPANDREECLAIKKVFGEYSRKLAVSSIKSMLGHTMGAASAIETVACCLAIKNDIIPPTINYETPDPECDIDCVPNVARKQKLNVVLNSSSAFGGNNACLVLKKPS
ncbi:MAG: beta-ketoacyl-[acyl-carrier-protein] synthase family protein [Candidatus Omnitrophica bacterium]|nr:beta-ketoacyl-[acyl-carrier-protein] synthase family protein [Candidatus Omnitrophota bacterium]